MKKKISQLSHILDHHDGKSIIRETRKIFSFHYPSWSFRHVSGLHKQIGSLFSGNFTGYRGCNTEYHDFIHTEEVLLAVARLIDGCNLNGHDLPLSLSLNLLRAALLHDTGYIQEEGDLYGTGAKYTSRHIHRSIEFMRKNGAILGIETRDMECIARLIRGTDFRSDFTRIEFPSDEERTAAYILGTADLLGQMSSRTYLEKLLFLYYEFREAGIEGYNTEYDMIYKTVGFYEFTKERLIGVFNSIFMNMKDHFLRRYNVDVNLYSEALDRNIEYLYTIIKDDTSNFRKKLKRGEWIHTYRPAL
ncbi:MAG TPA: hypothetical protein PK926_03785 [Spirochaetota bacterium]|nr:hypothetical protein [Spirochaetota bacterium]HPI91168.1 hypothetical protein [Spirochaetota bacterium]HPR46916.1 hypothetical protein [Spirochaetota bacterium]